MEGSGQSSVSSAWAVRIQRGGEQAAVALRLLPDLLAGQAEDGLWLRGPAMTEELDLALRRLATAQRFHMLNDGQLVPCGRRVPQGTLPECHWVPIATLFAVQPPTAALPGQTGDRVTLRLTRCGMEQEPSVLLTSLSAWAEYATAAGAVRLRPLRFAACQEGLVLIRGIPLPPIAGDRFVETAGIAVPCGWTWMPAIDAQVLRELLGLETDDLAVLDVDGGCQRIAGDAFVHARRSAVRLTMKGLTREQS